VILWAARPLSAPRESPYGPTSASANSRTVHIICIAVAARVDKTTTACIVRTESPDYARDLSSLQRTESFPIETEATDVLFHDGPFEEILRLSIYELTLWIMQMTLGLSILGLSMRRPGQRQSRLHGPLRRKNAANLGQEACRVKSFAVFRGNSAASQGRQAVFMLRQAGFFEKCASSRARLAACRA